MRKKGLFLGWNRYSPKIECDIRERKQILLGILTRVFVSRQLLF